MGHQRFHAPVGDMAVGVENPGGNFDKLAGVANQHNLAEAKAHRLFNHVADEVAHGDHPLWVKAHLFAHEALAVVARHQHHPFKPGGALHFQLQRQRALPALFRHRRDDAGGADNRDPAQNTQP